MSISSEVSELMKQVRDKIVLHVGVDDHARAAKLLEGNAIVESVREGDGHLVVTLVETAEDYSELPTALVGEGFKLNLFCEEDIDLESAFMALTKGTGANF